MITKFMEINSFIVAATGATFISMFAGITKYVVDKLKVFNMRVTNLEDSNIAILHDKIYKYCREYLAKGYVTVGDLDNLEYLFKSYKLLGGNGTGDTLYNKVKELKIKEESIGE